MFRWATVLSLVLVFQSCGGDASPTSTDTHAQDTRSAIQAAPVINGDMTLEQVFPISNWWNLNVSAAPLDPNSDAYIQWIGVNKQMHPDFGNPPYGIPYVVVDSQQPLVPIHWSLYGSESDDGAPGMPPGYPVPPEAYLFPNYIEGGVAGGGPSGDRHLLLVDKDNDLLYELWYTEWNSSLSRWEAGSGAAFDMATNDRRPEGWTSADAAGLAVFPGLIRADEVFGSQEIRHAFRFTTRATNGHVWPASHTAGSTSGAPPLGTRLRMKASVDISGYTPEVQKIFRAMKTYGLILADNGSDMYVQGTMDNIWNNGVLNPAFHSITASDFEVVQLGWNPTTSGVPEAN